MPFNIFTLLIFYYIFYSNFILKNYFFFNFSFFSVFLILIFLFLILSFAATTSLNKYAAFVVWFFLFTILVCWNPIKVVCVTIVNKTVHGMSYPFLRTKKISSSRTFKPPDGTEDIIYVFDFIARNTLPTSIFINKYIYLGVSHSIWSTVFYQRKFL